MEKQKRKQFSKDERRQVWNSCGNKCSCCGKSLKLEELTIEHVIPLGKGGTNNLENIVALCCECNRYKADKIYFPGDYYLELPRHRLIQIHNMTAKHFAKYPELFNFMEYPLLSETSALDMTKCLYPMAKKRMPNCILEFRVATGDELNRIVKEHSDLYRYFREDACVTAYYGYWRHNGKYVADIISCYDFENNSIIMTVEGPIREHSKQGIVNSILPNLIERYYALGTKPESAYIFFRDSRTTERFSKEWKIPEFVKASYFGEEKQGSTTYSVCKWEMCDDIKSDVRVLLGLE